MAQVPGEVDNMDGPAASNNNNNPAARWESPDRGWDREAPAAANAAASLFECSRIKALADEREAVQKKTFTKWVNSHLARVGCHIGDLYADLRDGFVLTRLLEVLSGEQLPRPTRGRMRIHSLENVDKALQFLKEQRVHLENVGSHDIVDGNHRLTLGLVWTIILRFQIQVIKIETEDNRETRSAKDALLLWCQMKTAGYPEVNIQNFTTSWRDGLAFNALIHRHRPDLVDLSKLTKSNANYNLQRAFRTAEQHLGLARLLDPEDVNMEAPDEKSIITYVVSYYHYFSKMKALAVEGKRIGKVLDQVLEVDKIIARYEELAAELLAWIHRTVGLISNQKFANSLSGVQQQLQAFTAYCTLEKPVKFQEKGNLEVLLFSIQSKLRAHNRRLFVPREGCGIWDIDKAWGELEKAEHEREAALRAELIRQEKLELLAQRFDHKVAMRESWLNENQRLVSQDNFGYELPAVEAAMKKHEAIEADIAAYEERVQGVAELAQALAAEGYYDARRVAAQRDSVLRQWALLTGLVGARRTRLEQNLALQKVFQEMVYMVDWMEEMQTQLLSRECGQHLVEADDLLQKHGLLEGDIAAQSERVEALNAAALRFSQLQGESGERRRMEAFTVDADKGLRREIQAHGPRLEEVLERAGALASLRSPDAEAVRRGQEQLQSAWAGLREAAERRQQTLDAAFQVEQYYFDVAEVEAWLGEQELLMMSEDKGKDEQSTLQLLKKHLQLEQGVENYEESIAQLSRQCRALLEMGHPDSEQISRRQSQVDRLYVALKELGEERRVSLEQQYWLYQLSRQVDELEHWIAEKEVVAGSPELGQDFEHVSVLQEKFSEFASETGTAGRERLAAVNQMVDELIECGHTAAATMAEWKDGLNEAWAELLELMGTRAQLLAASRELHKFFSDARELQGQIEEKRRRLPRLTAPPEPRPSASSMQRTLRAFEHDLQLLVSQVRQLQEGAAQLRTVYAGEHAEAIASREQEVLRGWKELLAACEDARLHVSSTADALRFHSQARDLLSWMDGIAGQIGAADKPRDVSSVEVLMNYHQGLKTELETRVPELTACQELGRSLLLNKSAMADEIQAQLDKLGTRKEEVTEKWDRHWEWLQQMLEVHQFAQEAVVADAWLTAQEPLLQSRELGSSVDEVEQLIRRHEAFRKAAAAWEERFSSLRRLTTIEKLKAEQSKQPPTPLLGRKFFGDPTELAAKAAPLLRPGGYDRGLEPLTRRASDTLSAEVRTRVGYVRQELKPERLQPRIDRLPEASGRVEPAVPTAAALETTTDTPGIPAVVEQVRPRPERQESVDRAEELPRRRRSERQESTDQPEEASRRRRPERQESADHEGPHSLTLGRYEQMERRRERRERRLERQESSEQETPARGELVKGKATLADIVEQLQEKEAGPGLTREPSLPQPRELPPGRLPNGLEPPERTPRPDRPRARDRPKPRRRPRPREGGEGGGSRRSRSAPAQGGSAPAPPAPPTHTVQHEGFLLRKRELDANRKSSNRSWVSLYCVLSKGELGFYKDSKGPASGGTHGGEPLLSLHRATGEVASDYRKKKHVFKLQTQDGSEFLLQAKDEEEMNGWLEAVASSVAEHAEIARWGQTLPTTSSTDEGNPKREGGERRASGRRK
ncbi:LOW QUALITY PROTEIN: spectrin beta chain, non-erythrocytic 4 [Acomys russatus]|uniref:LOW QUALITY PROTEIN: spectrin beta chain, non-erythrocytic 4 n=1 Tax=Acomys russatus TaxID=60746 RepID=UPI0021E31A04|nr:LOW QUALITY PROTEIN: spectrin beta chain, non-erythrocytic 4 [Acomys russatus]